MMPARCFFHGRGPCSGRLIRAHLLPAQVIKKEFPHGAWAAAGEASPDGPRWVNFLPIEAQVSPEMEKAWPHRPQRRIVDDPRVTVPVCGGPTGCSGHHGALDYARTLRLTRGEIPSQVEEFAREYGLTRRLDRDYGPREA